MKIFSLKNGILAALAAVGTLITEAVGGWDNALILLAAFAVMDLLTGWMVAAVWKKSPKSATGAMDSKANFKGLCKKVIMFCLVALGVRLDATLGTSYIRTAIIYFFIGNEGLSLVENLGIMGVPFPPFVKNMLDVLREKGGKGEEARRA